MAGSFDNHSNGARSIIITPPSPAISGQAIVVNAGEGALFKAPPFNSTVTNPDGSQEIVRVTAMVGDNWTIQRAAEPVRSNPNNAAVAIPIQTGARIENTITNKTLDDVEKLSVFPSKVWPGFGVNYATFNETKWAQDAALFKQIGIDNIRPSLATLFAPWSPENQIGSGLRRRCAQYFSRQGFYVQWGLDGVAGFDQTSTGPDATIVAEAQYLIDKGIYITEFNIGNESELFISSSQVPALNNAVRRRATLIKALPGWAATGIKIGYSMSQDGVAKNDWINNGLGDLDVLSYHPYGVINVPNNTVTDGGFPMIAQMTSRFGGRAYVSEFHLDPSDTACRDIDQNVAKIQMQRIFDTYIRNSGLTMFQFWRYDNYFGFQARNSDGSYRPIWDVFFQSGDHLKPLITDGQGRIRTDIV